MSSSNEDWPAVCRIVWLGGGLVAVNEPGALVNIEAGINGPICHEFQLPTFSSMYTQLVQYGFSVIGATHVVDAEANGIRPPEFRAWSAGVPVWRLSSVQQKWSDVSHAASAKNDMAMMDVASRISTELAYCEMRLLNLAEAYGAQLGIKARNRELEEFARFEDMNSSRVYLAIHALFWEQAALRDYLAEFAAKFLYGFGDVTSFAKLVGRLPKSQWKNDEIAVELVSAGNDDQTGWLATFSKYRDLFTHRAPMAEAAGIPFATQDQMTVAGGRRVPQLYYPLPGDVRELLSRRRSSGVLYKDMEEFIATARHIPKRETEPDALSYLHATLGQFALLAERLIQRSPIEPEMVHLTDADIVGPVKIVWPSNSSSPRN